MRHLQLLSGAILAISIAAPAGAEEAERIFVRQGLTVADTRSDDFPLAPEARSDSVNELVALLDHMRDSDKVPQTVVQTFTLDEVVRARTWRREVAYELQRRFP